MVDFFSHQIPATVDDGHKRSRQQGLRGYLFPFMYLIMLTAQPRCPDIDIAIKT